MTVIIQSASALEPSKRLLAATKKIKSKGTLTKADIAHARNAVNDHKNKERAAFVDLLQANEKKTEDELMEGLPHLTRPKRTKAGRPKGATAEEHREVVALAWRLKQRGLNTVEIGERLNVSSQTAGRYISEAKELLRIDPAKVDIPSVVGESLTFYDEVRETMMRLADEHPDPEVKIRAMFAALKCESDRTAFLQKVGVLGSEVAEYFGQLVVQQFILAGKKVDPLENFMHSIAQELLEAAHPAEVIEGEPHQGGVGS